MFWHSAANSNAIDNLLDQPDCTLTTILDQDEVLMEIRGMNKKLLEFLTRPDCLRDMLDLITTVPSADIPLPLQYKYPNTACEVLTSDISFAEKIAAEPQMMEKLFHFFRDSDPPLNPLLASYVCRVLGEMVARKLDQNWYSYQLNLIQVMGYLQSEANLLDWLLKHVETSSVCDFFHKMVMQVEGQDMRSSLYEWMEVREKFIMKLVDSMDRLHNKEAHMNISRLIGDLLFALQDETSSPSQDRSIESEPFLIALKSHKTFERLLDVIFGENTLSQSSIVYGLDILLALLGIAKKPTKQNPDRKCLRHYNVWSSHHWGSNPACQWARQLCRTFDPHSGARPLVECDCFGLSVDEVGEKGNVAVLTESDEQCVPAIKKVDFSLETNEDVVLPTSVRQTLLDKMSTLMRFLETPPRQPIRLSNGILNEPLGMERLAIVKFVAHIITLHDAELNDAMIQTGVLRKTLDLMWEHPWNNFLHHYVCQIVIQITKITRSNNCAKFLFIDYAFPEKILEAFENANLKAGYLGHLGKMTCALMDCLETNETVKSICGDVDEAKPEIRNKFKDFYGGKWKNYNETATQLLAGAALPSSGVSMASNTHNYESDPGVTWDSSSGTGLNSENDNNDFFDSSANYGSTDRYDDEKSKAIFEMFCFERSNSADDEEEDASFNRNEESGGTVVSESMPYESGQIGSISFEQGDEFEWQSSTNFFKQLEEQDLGFSQLGLNGTLGGDSITGSDGNTTSTFTANPWAGQESVQVDNTASWAAFDFASNDNATSGDDEKWGNFDQATFSAPTSFADFANAVGLFPASEESSDCTVSTAVISPATGSPTPSTGITADGSSTSTTESTAGISTTPAAEVSSAHVTDESMDESKPSQL